MMTGQTVMTFATIFDGFPAWGLVPLAFVALAFALLYRGVTALGVTAVCLFGLWNAGDPHPWIAFPVGLLIYGVLTGIAAVFGRAIGVDEGDEADSARYREEQARIATGYHRREREGRF